MTLMPQTIDGTVAGSSTSGGFTDYTVSLAPYDLFPMLAVQPGQTTVENNPSQIEVYVDSNTPNAQHTATLGRQHAALLWIGVQRQRHAAYGLRAG